MKKQLYRVKQFADQTLGRSGKSNALGEDLTLAEQRAEFIRNSCQNVYKKIGACLMFPSAPSDASSKEKEKEKLLRKSPEYILSMVMKQYAESEDGQQTQLQQCLKLCYPTEVFLAENIAERDHVIDNKVLSELQKLLETDIAKYKRKVTQLQAERDNANFRRNQAQSKQGGAQTKEATEVEDLEYKLDQSMDQLAVEMFSFILKESDACLSLLQLYRFRRTFYASAVRELDKLIPKLEEVVDEISSKKVYGTTLDEHLKVTKREIAYPIELCVCALAQKGIKDEGIFRLAGKSAKVRRMQMCFDAGCMTLSVASSNDPPAIADALKRYLRELKDPLMTSALYDDWVAVGTSNMAQGDRMKAIKGVIEKLPATHYANLRYLVHFFHKLSTFHEDNKMTSQNLAIVLAPNLLWGDNHNPTYYLAASTTVLQLLIQDYEFFFDYEHDFSYYVTLTESNSDMDGIDNKGFDPQMNVDNGMKHGQSMDSLAEEAQIDTPKAAIRQKKNKQAPSPPGPHGPGQRQVPATTVTLPRQKIPKDSKATATKDPMTQSIGSVEAFIKSESDSETSSRAKEEKIKTSIGTNTEYLDVKELRKQYFEPPKPATKPLVPARPTFPVKPSPIRQITPAQNYENVSISSTENLATDEKPFKTSCYTIDKQQPAIIKVQEKKRDRSREKKKSQERELTEHLSDPSDGDEDKDKKRIDMGELRRSFEGLGRRPSSVSGCDKPQTPPKPSLVTSPSSHTRTMSDGQIVDIVKRDIIVNEGAKPPPLKHPTESPPPPPVLTKSRANSQGDSTDL